MTSEKLNPHTAITIQHAVEVLASQGYQYTGNRKGDPDSDSFQFRDGKGNGVIIKVNPKTSNVICLDLRS